MNIRRHFSFAFVLMLGAFFSAASYAQPFGSVTPEKIAELESMHQQAMDSLLKNDFQGAIRAYSDILLMEPDDETAYTGLGQIYMIQGHFKKAHEAFQRALDINPENEVALVGVQRILDPDGTEGMVSRLQAQTEPLLPEAAAPLQAVSAPVSAPQAGMAPRQSAVKAKKGYVSPAPAPRPASQKVRRSPRLGRLGLLHAQRLQMALRKAGFYSGPVNGMIGSQTKSAIRDFQNKFGIQPSGRMTSATWSKLSEYLLI